MWAVWLRQSSSHLLFGVSCGENRGEINFSPLPSVVFRNETLTLTLESHGLVTLAILIENFDHFENKINQATNSASNGCEICM
jgi:hypothetical protein